MIEKAIYSLLANNSAITDLVSTRIYPQVREQSDALPAVTYQIISGLRAIDMSGPNGLVESRVQINCFAATILAAAELSAVVRRALSGFQGGAAGVAIECMLLEDAGDLPAIEPENERMNVYAKTMDFFVLYKEQ
jgi:hypothetical protein